jgi:hypothetical protein
MKAPPAFPTWAALGLVSLCFAPVSSAQLFHIVSKDSTNGFGTTDSWNNTEVALNAKFDFSVIGSVGTLKLTLTNLAGTAKSTWGDGTGNYTSGILTQFGFDTPTGLTMVSGSYSQQLAAGNGSEPNGISFNLDIPQTIGAWSFDFGGDATSNAKGLSGGYSAIFTFKFTGNATALSKFNSAGFFANNGTDADMGFRFDDVGSSCYDTWDKLAYWVKDNPPIPEPSTYGLMGTAALAGVIAVKRRRVAQKS